MLKCGVLVDALNGNYKGSYKDFEQILCNAVENEMLKIVNERNYKPKCIVESNLKSGINLVNGQAIGLDTIKLNKKIVIELMEGNKIYLIILFHELAHIRQKFRIKSGIVNTNIINYIKDFLLNQYQESENKRFGFNYWESYYNINHEIESREIDAELYAISRIFKFCKINGINMDDIKDTLIEYGNRLFDKKNNKRNLSGCITFNSYQLSLDEAFDVAIKYHPEWLNEYPQLLTEYSIIDGGIVFKKKKEMGKGVVNIYCQPKKKVKEKMYL